MQAGEIGEMKDEVPERAQLQDQFIKIQLTIQGTAGDLLAHDLPQLWERLKVKRINKRQWYKLATCSPGTLAPYNYWCHPRPPNAPSQDGKEPKAGEGPSENPTPATEQCSFKLTPGSPGTFAISRRPKELMVIQKIKHKADHNLTSTKAIKWKTSNQDVDTGMFTLVPYETSTKGDCRPLFPAVFPGLPAQKTRATSPGSATPRFALFSLAFTILVI